MVEELNSLSPTSVRYAQGLGIDEPLAREASGSTHYYEADGLGSITSLTDSTGARSNTYIYDSFGYLYHSTGSVTNPYRFTAREFDSETGLYYYRARYYDPNVGRFLSEDPLQFFGGVDFYIYTHNAPTSYIDAFGLQDTQEVLNDYANTGNIFTLLRANAFANEALRAAEQWTMQQQLPAGSLHNGPGDAFRHCFWSCNMTRYLGEYVAETIANEHEREGNRHGQPKGEELMDRGSNLMGRTAALNCPKNGKTCWDLCTDLYNQHRLLGLGGSPNNFPRD